MLFNFDLTTHHSELFGDAAAPVPQANDDENSDEEEDVMAQRAARRANPA